MDKQVRSLYDWAMHFFKNRDIFLKTIIEIIEEDDRFLIKYREKKQIIIPLSKIESYLSINVPMEYHTTIIVFNTRENFDFFQDHWIDFTGDRNLSVFFINPLSATEKRWMIYPYNHNSIADSESLKKGLKSLFMSVDRITPTQIKKIINTHEF